MSSETDVYKLFEKLYIIKMDSEPWTLPNPDKLFISDIWELAAQMTHKKHLNAVKTSLNNYPLQQWRKHTASRNPASLVVRKLKKELNSSFITQAWCKFYETVCTFELVPNSAIEANELKTVHLCEAPGGFITALNHYLVSNVPNLKWDWLATSINPHHEANGLENGIFEDKFIMKTICNWTFGEDHSGDITKFENLRDLMRVISEKGFRENKKLLLVTADGGFDCQAFPSRQEEAMVNLLTCEVVTALSILDTGGNLVVKAFTSFEAETICLIYLLSCTFESVRAWKPVSSKEGNSEMYLVAKGFIGGREIQPWLDVLYDNYGIEQDHAMFSLCDIPIGFLDQVVEMSRRFMDFQIEAIEENKNTFDVSVNPPPTKNKRLFYHDPYRLQKAVEIHFLERYRIKAIPQDRMLYVAVDDSQPAISQLNDLYDVNEDLTFSQANLGFNYFDERKSYISALKKSASLKNMFKCDPLGFFESIGVAVCTAPPLDFPLIMADVTLGQPVIDVKSSKFCHVWYLNLHRKIEKLFNSLKQPGQIEEPEDNNTEDNDISKPNTSHNDIPSVSQVLDLPMEPRASSPSSDDDEANQRHSLFNQVNVLLETYGESSYKTYFWSEILSSQKLSELMALISMLEEGGSLMMYNVYPIIRKCNVGLIFLIGQLFEQLLFLWPSEIKRNNEFSVLLHGYKPLAEKHEEICNFLHQILQLLIEEERKDEPKCILDLMSITQLCRNNFYNCIAYTNHLFLEQSAKRMINEVTRMLGLREPPL